MISGNQPYVRFKRRVLSEKNRSVLNKLKAKLVYVWCMFLKLTLWLAEERYSFM